MAQFSVGDAILSTEINTFTTGKFVSNDITSQANYAFKFINIKLALVFFEGTVNETQPVLIGLQSKAYNFMFF